MKNLNEYYWIVNIEKKVINNRIVYKWKASVIDILLQGTIKNICSVHSNDFYNYYMCKADWIDMAREIGVGKWEYVAHNVSK